MQGNIIIARRGETVIVSSIAADQCFVVTFTTSGKEFHGIINSTDKDFVKQECVKAGYPGEFVLGHTDQRDRNGLCHAYIVSENSSNGIFVEEVEDSKGVHLEVSPFKDKEFLSAKIKEKDYPEKS